MPEDAQIKQKHLSADEHPGGDGQARLMGAIPRTGLLLLAEQQMVRRMETRAHDRFMGKVYKMVECHRDSDAVYLLIDKYDHLQTQTHEFESLYEHVEQWGPSRTLLCLARLIIYKLDRERCYDRAIAYIEKCQKISPMFVLPELARVTF